MNFILRIVLVFLMLNTYQSAPVSRSNVSYDQRQTGELNIHLVIKDVAIIALDNGAFFSENDDDFTYDDSDDHDEEDDYEYDLDQLTVNPALGLFGSPPTTLKPTHKPSVPTSSHIIIEPVNTAKPTITAPPHMSHIVIEQTNTAKPTITAPPHTPDNIQETIEQHHSNVAANKPPKTKPVIQEDIPADPPSTTNIPIIQSTTPEKPLTDKPIIFVTVEPAKMDETTLATKKPTKKPNVIIITESTAAPLAPRPEIIHSSMPIAQHHQFSSQFPQQIPVQVVMEPVLRPKTRAHHKSSYMINRFDKKPSVEVVDSDLTNIQRRDIKVDRKCSGDRFRDSSGRCRNRREAIDELLRLLIARKNHKEIKP